MTDHDRIEDTAKPLADAELDPVNGGLLLPAVQKIREAATRITASPAATPGDGSVKPAGT